MRHVSAIAVLGALLATAGAVAWVAVARTGGGAGAGPGEMGAVAVEAAPIESGVIRDIRRLSGTLEASAQFVVAAKVDGLLERVLVDLGDPVERGQVIAEIDGAEFQQSAAQSEAELSVRRAELTQAQSSLDLAQRDFDRSRALKDRGIASDAQLDQIAAGLESARAAVTLAEAQVKQAEASLALTNIRLGYTQVRASWQGGDEVAIVGERHQDAGNTVRNGDPIVSVVALDPLKAVVSVTERDYSGLRVGQEATLTTDALPGRTFEAHVERIAPVFRETSRQARVELLVENPDQALRPGMFARVTIVLSEERAETIAPLAAVTRRDGRDVVFIVSPEGDTVRMADIRLGVVEGDRAQILGEGLSGRVVTLGQQLLSDGSRVNVHDGNTIGARNGATATPGGGAGEGP